MPKVEAAGVELSYTERGSGPAVVLVHGLAADGSVWESSEDVPGRVIAYDRRGYAESGAPEPYTQTTISEQAEDLAAVISRLDAAPALVVGADVGALVVLDLLLRHRVLARAAVLVDPLLYAFVPGATEQLSAERLALETALRDGGPGEAVAQWLGEAADPRRVALARKSARAFFADYGGLATLPLSRGELRGLDVPIGVVASDRLQPAADAVLRLAPQAQPFASWREAVAALA